MELVFGIVIIIVIGFFIFLKITCSPIISKYNLLNMKLLEGETKINQIITRKDIKDLPYPLQQYFIT
ncbi:MAG: hypothetical protein ACK5LC_03435 [Coprobacillaceae bacterium]